MDDNIKRDLDKERRTIWKEPYVWDEEKNGLFIKRSINYHETFKRIAKDILGAENLNRKDKKATDN